MVIFLLSWHGHCQLLWFVAINVAVCQQDCIKTNLLHSCIQFIYLQLSDRCKTAMTMGPYHYPTYNDLLLPPPHSRKRENHRQVLCLKTLSCPKPRKREREKLREWKENTSLSSQNISATLCPRVDANNFFDIFPDQTQWGSNRLVWLNWEETRKSAFFVKRWRFYTHAMQLIFLCRKLKI